MTLKEIAIFKHFIADKDLRKPFCKVYRASHDFAKLPVLVEDFFPTVEPLAVILSSMRVCAVNSTFGYDFWQDLHQEWKIYYNKIMASNFLSQDDGRLERLEGFYSILRENWNDKEKPWRYEDKTTACIRLGLPPIEESPAKDDEPTDTSETVPQEEKAPADPLADFEFLDAPEKQWTRLNRGDASLNFRSGSFKLTFNRYDSDDVYACRMTYVRLAKNKAGDLCLIFSRSNGIRITFATSGRNGKNLTINSKKLTVQIRTLLNITQEYTIIRINGITSQSDYIIYKLSKQ